MSAAAKLPDMAAEIAAAMEWWDIAGVDCGFTDEPTNWLADAVPSSGKADRASEPQAASPNPRTTTAPAPPPQIRLGGDKSNWPTNLSSFQTWWLEEPTLSDSGGTSRIAPRGEAEAALMIIVPHPEQADTDTLLSGPEGRLLASMLNAMQIAPEATYIASALPRHTRLPDWDALEAAGLGDVLARHVALAAPKRLLLLGRRVLSLLAHDTAQGSVALREFNHESAGIPAAAGAGLDAMLAQPGERARFWRRWLEWTA